MKLSEKDFYLDNNCEECEKQITRDMLKIEGVYYSKYDWEAGRLMLKYNPEQFQVSDLYEYLQKEGFSKPKDSTMIRVRTTPVCCAY